MNLSSGEFVSGRRVHSQTRQETQAYHHSRPPVDTSCPANVFHIPLPQLALATATKARSDQGEALQSHAVRGGDGREWRVHITTRFHERLRCGYNTEDKQNEQNDRLHSIGV